MKKQLRKSVFETNSSSTVDGTYAKNSVSHIRYPINGKTIDEMFQHISGQKPYEDVAYTDYVLEENCPTVGNFNEEILNKKVKQEYITLGNYIGVST